MAFDYAPGTMKKSGTANNRPRKGDQYLGKWALYNRFGQKLRVFEITNVKIQWIHVGGGTMRAKGFMTLDSTEAIGVETVLQTMEKGLVRREYD
jgi:hypothetical protein